MMIGPNGDDSGRRGLAWGCLAVAILIVCAAAGLAVIFAWDVNAIH